MDPKVKEASRDAAVSSQTFIFPIKPIEAKGDKPFRFFPLLTIRL
jgi:hypothetical protein